MLTDGQTLDPFAVEGSDLGKAPFVFLNACQVGAGNKILGSYGGMAAAFLDAGAAGVVAPLWSVKDTIARDIAESFYRQTADGTVGPAAALREARKGFAAGPQAQSATYLAYQFFGHPALKLHIAKP
jgi:CHAT domain-containing protein